MPRYDDTFVDRFLEPWNRHDIEGALALMMDKQTLVPKRIGADLASSSCGADMAFIQAVYR
jgi:hypothetical protein